MRDGEVGAAIAVGDPGGLAEAYDRYASGLYAYCRSLVREPGDAADAVQDTFVIAAAELAGLHDRQRLRPWLYAVARNECLRRSGGAAGFGVPVDPGPGITGTPAADVSGEAELVDLGTPLLAAASCLGAGERDLIQLRWQQGLDVAEIAAILGVSRNRAHALLSRAQDQLEDCLGALLVARTGGDHCAALGALLEHGDGQLTAVMRKRIDRHVRRCVMCARRRHRELVPALMFGLAPLAAAPVVAMPPGLRARVLRLANSGTPGAVAYRATVAQRTAPFRNHGFPKPIDPPGRQWRPSRQRQAGVAAGVAIAAAVAAATLLTLALAGRVSGRPEGAALAGRPIPVAGTSASTAAGTALPGVPGVPGSARPTRSGRASPFVTVTVSVSVAAGRLPPPAGSASRGSVSGSRPPASRPASGRQSSATPSARSPTVAATVSVPPEQGTLIVSATSITPLPGRSDTLILTASNGPVNWSITLSLGLIGKLTVAPSSGTLAAGATATVTVTPGYLLTVSGQLTVEPGGISVTVVPYS